MIYEVPCDLFGCDLVLRVEQSLSAHLPSRQQLAETWEDFIDHRPNPEQPIVNNLPLRRFSNVTYTRDKLMRCFETMGL